MSAATTFRQTINSRFSRIILGRRAWELQRESLGLLRKMGVDRSYFDNTKVSLPPGAEEYLQPSNPRLRELTKAYADFGGPATSHFQWSRKRIGSNLPLVRFRGDCAFVYQRRENTPANYLLSTYYILGSEDAWLIRKLDEDGLFGAQVVPVSPDLKVSRDLIDSTLEIAYLAKLLNLADGSEKTILEIGAGYGRLGHRLSQVFPNVRILCTDAVPESTFLCEYYLGFRRAAPCARAVPLHELVSLLEKTHVDIAVNIHSFPECTSGAIQWWLDLLSKFSVPYLLIVPNGLSNQGALLLNCDRGYVFRDFLGLVEASGYKRIDIQPKYSNPELQRYGGVSPTCYHLFELSNRNSHRITCT